ncbi:MAG: cell division protein FtsW (lipid II flippase), partial [Kiritimatiellia bacterium]
ELGVLGWGLLIVLYLIVFWRGISVVSGSKDLFTSLVAAAVTVLLASQTLINLGVVVGWMPAKGLVLPFMSYGASAVVAHLICIGLLLRLSMHNSEPKGASS